MNLNGNSRDLKLALAPAVVAVGLAFSAGFAEEGAVDARLSYPTLDRRAQIAPSVEFDRLRNLAHHAGHIRVIVGLRVVFTPEGASSTTAQQIQHRAIATANASIQRALADTDHRVIRTYEGLPLIALEVSESALTRLQESGLAATVSEDVPRPPSRVPAAFTAKAVVPEAADSIAMLDSGVAPTLRNARIIAEACFSANGDCPNGGVKQVGAGASKPCYYAPQQCQHGTDTAAVIARRGLSANLDSPTTDIIAIQVFSRFTGRDCKYEADKPCAHSYESDHIAGMQHVFQIRDRFKIDFVTLSLGSGVSSLGCDGNPLKLAIDNLRSAGITTLIASGTGAFRDAADVPDCIATLTAEHALGRSALPDLSVIAGDIRQQSPNTGAHFAVRGVETTFLWNHTTENIPDEVGTTKPAPASRTAAGFLVGTNFLVEGKRLPVPILNSGKQKSGGSSFSESFDLFDFGTYPRQVCANEGTPKINDRVPEDNCLDIGPAFSVIPAHLTGTIKGEIKNPNGLIITWNGRVDFVWQRRKRDDYFYLLAPGSSIHIKVSGDSGIIYQGKECLWTGSATYVPEASDNYYIHLRALAPSYGFNNKFRNGFSMSYHLDCLAGDFPFDMSGMPWMRSGQQWELPPFGPWHLDGTYIIPSPATTSYTWDLDASDN